MTDQDQDWFDLLAGREVEDVKPQTRQEVVALRMMILQHYQNELNNSQSAQDEISQTRGLKQLLERLEQEGLLEEPRPQAKTKPRRLRMYSAIAAAAAIFLFAFLFIPSIQKPLQPQTSVSFQEPPRLRSGMETQYIPVKDQRDSYTTAQQLIQQLTELSIPYRFTPLGETDKADWQLEIHIPYEPPDGTLTFLQQWRLKQTENGWIKLIPAKP